MSRPSVMSNHFSVAPQAQIPRSKFDRSFGHKTTFDAGYLVPIYFDEVLPGDTFNVNPTIFARLATPYVPLMDNMYLETFFFFVPNRLIWSNWQKFCGEQINPGDSTDYVVPTISAPVGGFANGSIFDYLSMPTGVASIKMCAFYCRAYNIIYNQWFRDENLQNSVTLNTGDGPDPYTDYVLLRRGKRYDYFTACLPWPQKGPSVTIPLGGTAPVYGPDLTVAGLSANAWQARNSAGSVISGVTNSVSNAAVSGRPQYLDAGPATASTTGYLTVATKAQYTALSGLGVAPAFADLSTATASTINTLRQAFQIQKLYERDARGGTRYTEILKSHFFVQSPDARLQRPEYLGGGFAPILISPVAQTAPQQASGVTTPQANLAAFGTVTLKNQGFVKSFVEHGVILGLVSVRADLTYQQGIRREFSRSTRFDYYWPALSHIGEQGVLNQEIFAQGTSADTQIFGYQERYAEYRYKQSVISGQFRSNFAQTLDIWHLSQYFTALPVLNSTFIQENPPLDRITATTDDAYPHFLLDSFFRNICARPMPAYSVPGFVDHF